MKRNINRQSILRIQQEIALTVLIVCILSVMSCKKFVEIPPPDSQIVTTTVFNDVNAATAAVTAIYSAMQQESWIMSQCTGLLGDELQSYSTSNFVRPYYLNRMTSSTSPTPGPWVSGYNYIYQANAVIEGLRGNKNLSEPVQNQLIGEAKFIRAFWNFYLVNCYGDVPLILTTDYTTNQLLIRSTASKVYNQIVADLLDAENLLNANYVNQTDTAATTDRIRPNKSTALALLARAYLYSGDYANAESASSAVISDSRYQVVQDLNKIFLINSTEAIWQLQIPSPANQSTIDGLNYILTAAPTPGSPAQTATIAPGLWNSFEPNDQRKINWIGSIITSNPTDTFYFPYKYKSNSLPVTEYTMMFRLAEQYLIHSESLIRQNKNLDQAALDINVIRNRAGLGIYSGPLNQDSLLSAVIHERQTELFTEWGHRWFDLIRIGNIDAVMSVVNPQKGGQGWNPELALFPIPRNEIKIDFNLTQNPGY